jgi:hypothetical protein
MRHPMNLRQISVTALLLMSLIPSAVSAELIRVELKVLGMD